MSEFGELLRQAREFKGVTLREAERTTRISRNHLAALEAEEFSDLPAAAYARGIVRKYADYLGLDPSSTLERFEVATGETHTSAQVVAASSPIRSQTHWVPNFAIIAFMVVMSAVVFTWMYSAYFQESASLATSTVGVPTVTPVSGSILALTTPPATIEVQSGGGESINRPADAMVTPQPSQPTPETMRQVEPEPTPSEDAVPAVEEAEAGSDIDSDENVSAEPIGTGAHTFVIWVLEDVWLTVALDGQTVFDDVLPADAERVFYADSAVISSGNSAFVQLWVDGVAFGTLGDTWDAVFTYP
jgi:cytoskeleton protein RodZ